MGCTVDLKAVVTALTRLEQELARLAAVFGEPGWWAEALMPSSKVV
jgi:hypothetical protein